MAEAGLEYKGQDCRGWWLKVRERLGKKPGQPIGCFCPRGQGLDLPCKINSFYKKRRGLLPLAWALSKTGVIATPNRPLDPLGRQGLYVSA